MNRMILHTHIVLKFYQKPWKHDWFGNLGYTHVSIPIPDGSLLACLMANGTN